MLDNENNSIKIKFDISNNRAIALHNNVEIGVCEFIDMNECWNIVHTEVNSSYQGQGIARKLVERVIESANINNKKIVADCSYARKIINNKGGNK